MSPHHLTPLTSRCFILLGLCLALGCSAAWAEKADKNKPMNAEADAMRYDDLKQTYLLTGNAVVTKGSIVIRGAQIDARTDPEGFQFGTAIEKDGKRAFFRQKRDTPQGAPEEWMEGEAETIYYDGKADTVTFTKSAILRRYRGAAVSDETQGNVIVYNNLTDVFSVSGGAANISPSNPTGRVRTMISPKSAASAPAVAAPPAALRPSTTIGGERK
jgi:lipopolysaccharide export system protein LptA